MSCILATGNRTCGAGQVKSLKLSGKTNPDTQRTCLESAKAPKGSHSTGSSLAKQKDEESLKAKAWFQAY